MAAPSVIRAGVGLRDLHIFALNSNGYPAASGSATSGSAVVYEGLFMSGAKSLTINDPAPRNIFHTGDDSVFAVDLLPPTEAITGEIAMSKVNDTLDALVMGQHTFSVGEANLFGVGTNKRGFEAQVALMWYRIAVDADPDGGGMGNRTYECRILPKALVFPREGSFNETPETRPYNMLPMFCTRHLWGTQFQEAVEGYTRGQMIRVFTQYKPKLVAWDGDGATLDFPFNPVYPAQAAAKVDGVWVNGVLQTTGFVKLVTGITFTSAPAVGASVVCLYEYL
jgi:hypothetical protein